ncbi:MAG: hypothetical protein KAI75_07565, partial [Desulfobulbaceae bacterium]|nr:hypothetical protein [Desulfobulbaceae bacterium]
MTLWSCVPEQQTRQLSIRKTCVECHEDMAIKYKQGVVHAPVMEDKCGDCHLSHGLIGGTHLRQNPPKLCLACHRQIPAEVRKKYAHSPVKEGKCSICHNPHNSSYKGLLNKPLAETCLSCHDKTNFARENEHSPMQDGCMTCHENHAS